MRAPPLAALALVALAVVGCKKNDAASDSAKAADSAAAAAAAAPAPATASASTTHSPLTPSDIAGKWTLKAMAADRDTVLVTCDLTASADTTAWSQVCNGQKIPQHVVSFAGDSIVTHAGPYPSVLRKGVQVTTDGVLRLQGDKLVGTMVAHYRGAKGADSVLHLRSEGTRAP